MARIGTYTTDDNVTGSDKVLGTDTGGSTKNYELTSIADYFSKNNEITIGGQVVYRFKNSDGGLVEGEFTMNDGGSDGEGFSNITSITIHKAVAQNKSVSELLERVFKGHFRIYGVDTPNDYYDFEVTRIQDHPSIDNMYFVEVVPISGNDNSALSNNEYYAFTANSEASVNSLETKLGQIDSDIAIGNSSSVDVEIKGKLGVGTSSPAQKLHVDGNIRVGDASDAVFSNKFNALSNANLEISSNSGYSTVFKAGASEVMHIASDGKVGVGISSPAFFLSLDGSTTNKIAFQNGSGIYSDKAYIEYVKSGDDTNLAFGTTSDTFDAIERMRITHDGKVGIGTTSPSVDLEVAGVAKFTGNGIYVGNGNSGVIYYNNRPQTNIVMTSTLMRMKVDNITMLSLNEPSFGQDEVVVNEDSSNVDFRVEGNNDANLLFTEADTDRVGIGTNDPTEKLTVTGNINLDGVTRKLYFDTTNAAKQVILGVENNYEFHIVNTRGNSSRLMLGNGSITLGTSSTPMFYINTASGNVGIGTTSPAFTLDVPNGSARFNDIRLNDGRSLSSTSNGNGYVVLSPNNGDVLLNTATSSNNITMQLGAGNPILTLKSNNVGIGTTSPSAKLDVNGTIKGDGLSIGADTNINAVIGRFRISSPISDYAYLSHYDHGTSSSYALRQAATGRTDINAASGRDIYFNINNSAKAVLMSTGNVGIGTTSPESALQVTGTVPNSPTTNGVHIGQSSDGNYGVIQAVGATGGYIDFSASGYDRDGRILYQNSTDTMQFQTGATTRMIIAGGGGNVGIGTTNPSTKLNLKESNTGTEGFIITNWNNVNTLLLGSDSTTGGGKITLRTNGGNSNVFISSYSNSYFNGGNVGIGTTAPTDKLDVFSSTNNSRLIRISHPTAPTNASGFLGFNTDGTTDNFVVTIGVQYDSSYYDVINIHRETRNVGIGTTNPGTKLEVSSSGAEGILISKDTTTTSNSGRLFFETDTVSEGFSFANSNGLMTIRSQAQAGVTSGNARVAIDGSGNVGIGTTNPTAKLRILAPNDDGILLENGNALLGNTGSGYAQLIYWSGGNMFYGRNTPSVPGGVGATVDNHIFRTNGTTRLQITEAGNVGIGTSSPARELHLHSADNTQIQFTDDSTGSANTDGLRIGWNGDVGQMYLFEDADIRFATNDSEKMRITSGGNVGIGTTSPSEKLDVVGRVQAERFRTTTGGNSSFAAYYFLGDADTGTFQPANNMFAITTAAAERMRITNTGNVGIGTTSPDAPLTVTNNAVSSYIINVNMADDVDGGGFYEATGGMELYLKDTSGTGQVKLTSSGSSYLNGGNIGIGTTSPGSKLTVSGDIFTTAKFVTDSNELLKIYQSSWADNGNHHVLYNAWKSGTGDYLLVKSSGNQDGSNGAMIIADGNGGRTFFGKHSNEGAALDSSTSPLDETYAFIGSTATYFGSNVGIGTNSPLFTAGSGLEIQRSGTATLRLDSGNHATELRAYTNGTFLGQLSASYLDLGTNSSTRVRITSSGSVGIGTTTPDASAILEVKSTTKGVLFPKMTEVQKDAISSPATGLIIYQTDATEGLYIYKSTGWTHII